MTRLQTCLGSHTGTSAAAETRLRADEDDEDDGSHDVRDKVEDV